MVPAECIGLALAGRTVVVALRTNTPPQQPPAAVGSEVPWGPEQSVGEGDDVRLDGKRRRHRWHCRGYRGDLVADRTARAR